MKKYLLVLMLVGALVFCISCEKDDTKNDDSAKGGDEVDFPYSDGSGSITLPEDVFD